MIFHLLRNSFVEIRGKDVYRCIIFRVWGFLGVTPALVKHCPEADDESADSVATATRFPDAPAAAIMEMTG